MRDLLSRLYPLAGLCSVSREFDGTASAPGQYTLAPSMGGASAPEVAPTSFQARVIDTLRSRVLDGAGPVLLRAPTGSGKTLMLARAVEATAHRLPTVWFWFVPYQHLVGQTIAALRRTAPKLSLFDLSTERQSDHHAGDVLVANVQVVAASNTSMRKIYLDDDGTVGLKTMVDRARLRGLRVGAVIDEAHLGLSSETVFGGVIRQLQPESLLMATATPRDEKLAEFVAAAGFSQFTTIPVSRLDAVNEGLNKRFVVARVLNPSDRMKSVADVTATVLQRAVERRRAIREALEALGVKANPLLLVQVENGAGKETEALAALTRECGVPLERIGVHTQDNPDPAMLATVANDESIDVLVFKEAAGTGFDAPRAFVLASTKRVSDQGFATQFIGRIMRVDPRVRRLLGSHSRLPADIDTGYLYLASDESQEGFALAVDELAQVETQLGGVVEQLRRIEHRDGSVTFTNRETVEPILDLREPALDDWDGGKSAAESPSPQIVQASGPAREALQSVLFGPSAGAEPLFNGASTGQAAAARAQTGPFSSGLGTEDRVRKAWTHSGVAFYRLRNDVPELARALLTERSPGLSDYESIATEVARSMPLSDEEITSALVISARGLEYREAASELTNAAKGGDLEAIASSAVFRGALDRSRLAMSARAVLQDVGFDDADRRTFVRSLADRVRAASPQGPTIAADIAAMTESMLRDAAHLLVHMKQREMGRLFHSALAAHVRVADADALPLAVLFPSSVPLPRSSRNIYGVRPPTDGEWERAELVEPELGQMLRRAVYFTHKLDDGTEFPVAYMDGTWRMNESERRLALALDSSDWVRWWHRNPDRKPFSVGVVKATESGQFYPDFVVCVRPEGAALPRVQLLEHKESGDDARVKMERAHNHYGRVYFLKVENDILLLRNADGTLSEVGDLSGGLDSLRAALAAG